MFPATMPWVPMPSVGAGSSSTLRPFFCGHILKFSFYSTGTAEGKWECWGLQWESGMWAGIAWPGWSTAPCTEALSTPFAHSLLTLTPCSHSPLHTHSSHNHFLLTLLCICSLSTLSHSTPLHLAHLFLAPLLTLLPFVHLLAMHTAHTLPFHACSFWKFAPLEH